MKKQSAGFTIVELMIATTVLSVILLLVTVVMTGIGRLYYKGINQSRIQSNARSIAAQIAQDVQLSSNTPSTGSAVVSGKAVQVICVGNVRYTYVVNNKINTNGYKHVLWRDTPAGGCSVAAGADLTLSTPSDGDELISPSARLTKLNFPPMTSGLQKLQLGIAYGDDDLLTTTDPVQCKGGSATQFCATSDLSTVVVQRVTNN